MTAQVPVKRIERSQACTNAVELATTQLQIDCLRTAPGREIPAPELTLLTPSELCAPDDKMLRKELLSGL